MESVGENHPITAALSVTPGLPGEEEGAASSRVVRAAGRREAPTKVGVRSQAEAGAKEAPRVAAGVQPTAVERQTRGRGQIPEEKVRSHGVASFGREKTPGVHARGPAPAEETDCDDAREARESADARGGAPRATERQQWTTQGQQKLHRCPRCHAHQALAS